MKSRHIWVYMGEVIIRRVGGSIVFTENSIASPTVATEFMDCFGFRRVSIVGSKIHVHYNILLNFLYA